METLPHIRPADEHDLYPIHAEDTLPEGEVRYRQAHYLAELQVAQMAAELERLRAGRAGGPE